MLRATEPGAAACPACAPAVPLAPLPERGNAQGLRRYARHLANGGWVVAIQLARQLMALVFLMVLVRTLEMEAIGQFQFVLAGVALAGVFTLPGLGQAVIQSVARGHMGTFRAMMKWRLAGSLLGAGALLAHALSLPPGDPLRAGFMVAAALFPLSHGLSGWAEAQMGEGHFRRNALWLGLAYLLSYGGMTVALLLGVQNLVWLVALMLLALAAVNIAALARLCARTRPAAPPEEGALRYGLQMSLWGAVNICGNQIDKVVIFAVLSPAALAIFVVAERIPEILKKYIQSLRGVLIPGLARRRVYSRRLQRQLALLGLGLSVVILAVIFLVVPWLLPLAFTDAYGEAVLYCQLLCATLILGQVAQTRMAFILSRFDAQAMRNVVLIGNAVRILASVVLIPVFGLMGAVMSAALYRLCTALTVSVMMRRYSPVCEA